MYQVHGALENQHSVLDNIEDERHAGLSTVEIQTRGRWKATN